MFVIFSEVRSLVEEICPVGDLENNEVVPVFVVHDRHDVATAVKLGKQKAIPRLEDMK